MKKRISKLVAILLIIVIFMTCKISVFAYSQDISMPRNNSGFAQAENTNNATLYVYLPNGTSNGFLHVENFNSFGEQILLSVTSPNGKVLTPSSGFGYQTFNTGDTILKYNGYLAAGTYQISFASSNGRNTSVYIWLYSND